MLVKKDSWHYRLVQDKDFVSKPKSDNSDSMVYVGEVGVTIFLKYLCIPLVLTMFVAFVSGKINTIMTEHWTLVITFFILLSTPIWFTFLTIAVEPLTKKEWRKLEIRD